jgi:crotonobetainyl-CoA:carnitine CoA-transferase CaiB-like acyl-CoA transferase
MGSIGDGHRGADMGGRSPLAGLEVLEMGGTISAAAAGNFLARLGASVRKIDAPRERRGAPPPADSTKARLLQVLDYGKTVISAESYMDPLTIFGGSERRPDVTVVDLSETDYLRCPVKLADYHSLVESENTASWVTLTPFGMFGPRQSNYGSELTFCASGGLMHYMRSLDGRPMKPAGFTASLVAGSFAVLAGLHGLLLKQDRGTSSHLDLSVQDSVIVSASFLECAHQMFESVGRGGVARHPRPSGYTPCADGSVWLVTIEDHHWQGCVRAMGDPEWARDIHSRQDRLNRADEVQQGMNAWAADKSAHDVAEILQREGVPATVVNSCSDLLSWIGSDVREGFFAVGEASPHERVPTTPVQVESRDLDRAAQTGPPHRILDLTHVLAGPIATSWLGAMGIDVLKIEDGNRPDFYRRIGPYMHGQEDLELSAYFASANYSKRSYEIDLSGDAGRARLAELVATADLVVENLGIHRSKLLNLTPDVLNAEGGPTLISSSGFGHGVAHEWYRVYGMNIHASGGVIHLSRDHEGNPRNLGTSWGDPITAVWIAILAVAQLLRPPMQRQHVDVSMVEAIATLFPEYFSILSRDGVELVADESRLDYASPHGVYQTAGEDNWIALAVESDSEWKAMLSVLGKPEDLSADEYGTLPGRLSHQDGLDESLARLLSEYDADELVAGLQQAGVIAAKVVGAQGLVADEHLWDRAFFQRVEHPRWGLRALTGLPWRNVRDGAFPISRTPLLGEHTSADPSEWWAPRKVR